MVINDGQGIPILSSVWDPSDTDWVWIAWDNVISDDTISLSVWTLPTGWTSSDTQTDQSIVDEDGNTYTHANGVLISNSSAVGGTQVTVGNKVTFAGGSHPGRVIERSVTFLVKDA